MWLLCQLLYMCERELYCQQLRKGFWVKGLQKLAHKNIAPCFTKDKKENRESCARKCGGIFGRTTNLGFTFILTIVFLAKTLFSFLTLTKEEIVFFGRRFCQLSILFFHQCSEILSHIYWEGSPSDGKIWIRKFSQKIRSHCLVPCGMWP